MKKDLEVAVLSDIHLGAVGCKALQCVQYLNSINPRILVLNGDIIDIWNFRKFYWPESHMLVIKTILNMMANGTKVYYLTGNHDELLRKISNVSFGSIHLRDNLVLELDGQKCWFFHGDIFDVTMKYSKWIAKLGGIGYDLLILLNLAVNSISKLFGKDKISLSKRVKESVKQAVEFVQSFETTAIDVAFDEGYNSVFCGHIHKPAIRTVKRGQKQVHYYNSGDWIENMTSLEYDGEWKIFSYEKDYEHRIEVLSKEQSISNHKSAANTDSNEEIEHAA